MKIELLDHPDRSSNDTVYRYTLAERAIELWPSHKVGLYHVWESAACRELHAVADEYDVQHTKDEPVSLCTAQLMALKLLGVE